MQDNKAIYRQFCKITPEVPLFLQPSWLDAVCTKGNWDVLIHYKNQSIAGVWAYFVIHKWGFKLIIQPQLTQMSGIWVNHAQCPFNQDSFNFEKEVLTALTALMKQVKFSYLDQNMLPALSNWLPLYWDGFTQTTRYTYRIDNLTDMRSVEQSFRPSKRAHLRKAQKQLKVNFTMSGEQFYDLVEKGFRQRKQKMHYSRSFFMHLYREMISAGSGVILSVHDREGIPHAALFLVWDQHICYNLISMIHPEQRNSGASSLAFFEAIRFASTRSLVFDFEGSMNRQIEQSFRELGGIQTPYFRIIKKQSMWFEWFHCGYGIIQKMVKTMRSKDLGRKKGTSFPLNPGKTSNH